MEVLRHGGNVARYLRSSHGPVIVKATVLYPWSDILERRTGASLRVGLLIDYLKERCESVCVFSPAERQDVQLGSVQYVFYGRAGRRRGTHSLRCHDSKSPSLLEYRKARLVLRLYRTVFKGFKLCYGSSQSWCLDRFYRPRFDRFFRSALESLIPDSDVVFLEYPFWARIVLPSCKEYQVPCIVTAHDILSISHASSSVLKRLLLRSELWALRSATHACCVSEEDARVLRRYGVEADTIVNPVDLTQCVPETREDVIRGVLAKHGVPKTNMCLFVGSRHGPNIEAARIIDEIALKVPDCTFVIAGDCAASRRAGNVMKLGKIGQEELRVLYAVANLVLVPLRTGTGASLKLIEAMAYGRPILTSTVGCRGYAFEADVHGVVSDDFGNFPALIKNLMEDKARRAKFSHNAKLLAEKYNYRTVYERYWKVICAIKRQQGGEAVWPLRRTPSVMV